MSLRSFLGRPKAPPLVMTHPEFGEMTFSRHDGWTSKTFSFWGFEKLELLVDSDDRGPTEMEVVAFRRLRESKSALLPRCIDSLDSMRREMKAPPGQWVVSGLTIPRLDESPAGKLWTLWFDSKDDDHYMYGIQSDDEWSTLIAFADD